MDRIFEHSRDLHVRNYVVYAGSDGYAYTDVEETEQITAGRLADAFKKGLLVKDDGKFYVPTAMVYEDGVTTVTYVKADSSTQTTAVLTLASSIDYPLEALLETLTIGALTLTPTFDGDTFTYTASTIGASEIITAVATDPDASIVIRNGTAVVPNGTAATWAVGANVVTITVKNGEADNVYTVTVTKTLSDTLASLTLGELTLSPAFDSGTTTYTAATTDESNVITAVATGPEATIAILHGETPVENGTAATWTVGANVVTITVTNGEADKVYTVTVTKTLPDNTLASLALGALGLSPAFGSETTSYTAATTDVSNIITAAATDPEATIAIMHGETPVENGAAITWEDGANTVTVAVTNGTTKTYTVTVTKS